jgi:hypothetical protein
VASYPAGCTGHPSVRYGADVNRATFGDKKLSSIPSQALLQHNYHPGIGRGRFAVGGIETLGLVADQFYLTGRFWNFVSTLNDNFGMLGYFIIGLFAISWIISIAIYKWRQP